MLIRFYIFIFLITFTTQLYKIRSPFSNNWSEGFELSDNFRKHFYVFDYSRSSFQSQAESKWLSMTNYGYKLFTIIWSWIKIIQNIFKWHTMVCNHLKELNFLLKWLISYVMVKNALKWLTRLRSKVFSLEKTLSWLYFGKFKG